MRLVVTSDKKFLANPRTLREKTGSQCLIAASPFHAPAASGEEASKKDLYPTKGPACRYLWDKSLETSAVPPKLAVEKTAPSAARQHAPFLGNGGKARRSILGEIPFSPPSAVHSPGLLLPPSHHRRLSLRTKALPTRPRHRFALLNLRTGYASRGGFVKHQNLFRRI